MLTRLKREMAARQIKFWCHIHLFNLFQFRIIIKHAQVMFPFDGITWWYQYVKIFLSLRYILHCLKCKWCYQTFLLFKIHEYVKICSDLIKFSTKFKANIYRAIFKYHIVLYRSRSECVQNVYSNFLCQIFYIAVICLYDWFKSLNIWFSTPV